MDLESKALIEHYYIPKLLGPFNSKHEDIIPSWSYEEEGVEVYLLGGHFNVSFDFKPNLKRKRGKIFYWRDTTILTSDDDELRALISSYAEKYGLKLQPKKEDKYSSFEITGSYDADNAEKIGKLIKTIDDLLDLY